MTTRIYETSWAIGLLSNPGYNSNFKDNNRIPILKFVVHKVGQVNNRGNIIYIGIEIPRGTSPSPICIFCISVTNLWKMKLLKYKILLKKNERNIIDYCLWRSLQRNRLFLHATTGFRLIWLASNIRLQLTVIKVKNLKVIFEISNKNNKHQRHTYITT